MILLRFRFITAYLILFLFSTPSFAQSASTANKTLIEKELGNIPELQNSQIDLLETLLLISRHWNPSLEMQSLRDEISNLVLDVKNNLKG